MSEIIISSWLDYLFFLCNFIELYGKMFPILDISIKFLRLFLRKCNCYYSGLYSGFLSEAIYPVSNFICATALWNRWAPMTEKTGSGSPWSSPTRCLFKPLFNHLSWNGFPPRTLRTFKICRPYKHCCIVSGWAKSTREMSLNGLCLNIIWA